MSTRPCRLTRVQSLFKKTCSKSFQMYEKRENQLKKRMRLKRRKTILPRAKYGIEQVFGQNQWKISVIDITRN